MDVVAVQDGDVEGVVRLWHEAGLVRPWNDPHADLDLARRSPSSQVLVARDGDAVVGTVLVGLDGHRGWLYYLAVADAHRRRGLGRELVRAAEAWLTDAGAPKVQLMVRSGNTGVLGLYAALGYEQQDVVVLGRWLGPT